VIKEKPDAKIAVLYQNDDFGKDYLKGLKDGLGAMTSMITAEESYETSEPAIDGHIVKLRASGADVFVSITTRNLPHRRSRNSPRSNGSRCISSPMSLPRSVA